MITDVECVLCMSWGIEMEKVKTYFCKECNVEMNIEFSRTLTHLRLVYICPKCKKFYNSQPIFEYEKVYL